MCPKKYDANSEFKYEIMANGVQLPSVDALTISHYQNVFAESTYVNAAGVQNPTVGAQPLYGNQEVVDRLNSFSRDTSTPPLYKNTKAIDANAVRRAKGLESEESEDPTVRVNGPLPPPPRPSK
jgi:hypothetical protein